jgi:hypothetical protein
MEVNITPDEIDKYVKTAIIESSVGKIIKEAGDKFMTELIANRYDSPIKAILHNVIKDIFSEKIRSPENIKLIEGAVAAAVTDTVIQQVINKMLQNINYVSVNF